MILALVFVITSLGGDGPSSSERRPPGQQVDVPLCTFTSWVHLGVGMVLCNWRCF